jgi:hypothetical protein
MKPYLYVVILVLMGLTACEKDPLTLPSRVNLQFGMTPRESGTGQTGGPETQTTGQTSPFVVNQGNLTVGDIAFEGRRRDASDVFFTAEFNPPILSNLSQGTSNQPVSFDIPQGVYQRIEMVFELGAPGHLPLELRGMASLGPLGNVPVLFQYHHEEAVRVVAKASQGQEIVLDREKPSTARVIIDADFLFRLVNTGMLLNADITSINGEAVILISNNTNNNIFNMVAARLSQSFQVVFE